MNNTVINELINSAFRDTHRVIHNDKYYIVEANPQKNELRIKTQQEMTEDNLNAFAEGIHDGFIAIGFYDTLQKAKETINSIRQLLRNKDGNCLL